MPVLNPALHDRLRTVFGTVKLANEGEAFRARWYHDPVTRRVKAHVYSSGEYYLVNCPFCGDTRTRLWINHQFGNEDPEGKPMYHWAICYNEDNACLSNWDNKKSLVDTLFGFVNSNQARASYYALSGRGDLSAPPSNVRAQLPGEVIPMSQLAFAAPRHPAVEYMVGERRYDIATLDRYNIMYCSQASQHFRTASNRIIFPVVMNGALKGWQARHIGKANWSVVPKYWGMPGMQRRHLLYNYDFAAQQPYVVVTEGPTDANAVGDAGVALMGKGISPEQKRLIAQTWDRKPVIVILDEDADDKAKQLVMELGHAGMVAIQISLPSGFDCGDYDRSTLNNIIHTYASSRGINLPV